MIPCHTAILYGNVGLVSGASVAVADAMFELTPAIIDKVAFETGRSDGLVLATLNKDSDVTVGRMMLLMACCVAVDIGRSDGFVLATLNIESEVVLILLMACWVAALTGKSEGAVLYRFPSPTMSLVMPLTVP